VIEPYNEAWVTAFNNLQKKLHKILEGLPAEIQHVGSTSIPGVWAKPIIDLDIIIEDKSLLDEISVRLQKADISIKENREFRDDLRLDNFLIAPVQETGRNTISMFAMPIAWH